MDDFNLSSTFTAKNFENLKHADYSSEDEKNERKNVLSTSFLSNISMPNFSSDEDEGESSSEEDDLDLRLTGIIQTGKRKRSEINLKIEEPKRSKTGAKFINSIEEIMVSADSVFIQGSERKRSIEDYKAKKKEKMLKYKMSNKKDKAKLAIKGNKIYVANSDGTSMTLAGIIKKNKNKCLNMELRQDASIQDFSTFVTECRPAATGEGYSLYMHGLACFLLKSDKKYWEYMGSDVTLVRLDEEGVDNVRVEMTGIGFKDRKTNCDVVMNKYVICDSIFGDNRLYKFIRSLSVQEDMHSSEGFRGSSFDTVDSPYTEKFNKIYAYAEMTDEEDMKKLADYADKWYKSSLINFLNKVDGEIENNEVKDSEINDEHNKTELVDSINKIKTTKKTNKNNKTKNTHGPLKCSYKEELLDELNRKIDKSMKNGMLPSPFRLLPPLKTVVPDSKAMMMKIKIKNTDWKGTTYYSRSRNNIHNSYHKENPNFLDTRTNDQSGTYAAIEAYLHKKKIYRCALMEAELFTRIISNEGEYYNEHNHHGISWYKSKGSNKYYVRFYTFSEIYGSEDIGIWKETKIDENLTLREGPVFTVNNLDINYALTLPSKMFNIVSSCIDSTTMIEYLKNEESIWKAIATMYNSNWYTSKICKDFRFITTLHFSQSGDIYKLLKKIPDAEHYKNSDIHLINNIIEFLKRETSYEVTPIFEIPFVFSSLEKDLGIALSWHQRHKLHDTDCMRKIISNTEKEVKDREIILSKYDDVILFYKKFFNNESTQQDFNNLCENKDVTFLNLPLFTALAYIAEPDMNVKTDKMKRTKNYLSSLISDKGSCIYEDKVLKEGKVSDMLEKELINRGNPGCLHTLLAEQAMGPKKIEEIYSIFAKDAKGSDREIPKMTIDMRANQLFTEEMSGLYAKEVESDVLEDPVKFQKVVNSTTRVLNSSDSKIISSSEDRKNFCHEIHPEKLGAVSIIMAKITHTLGMYSSASLLSCRKQRKVVAPRYYDDKRVEHKLRREHVKCETNGSIAERSMFKSYKNMEQGVLAKTAAMVNLIHALGFRALQERNLKIIDDSYIAITSDDTLRSYAYKKTIARDLAEQVLVCHPADNLFQFMMVNNIDKWVSSDNFIEFNNIIVTKDGMLSQSPVYSTLASQPLISDNIIADLMACVNNARSFALWGGNTQTSLFAYKNNLKMFMRKWLIKPENVEKILEMKLIPHDLKSFYEGFFPRTEEAKSFLYNALTEEQKERAKKDKFNLLKESGKRYIHYSSSKRKRRKTVKLSKSDTTVTRHIQNVYTSRIRASKLRPMNTRNMSLNKRVEIKKKFEKDLDELGSNILINDVENEVFESFEPIKIELITRNKKPKDNKPTMMGNLVKKNAINTLNVKALRFGETYLNDDVTEKEKDIANMEIDEYIENIEICETEDQREGLRVKAPGGLPTNSMDDVCFFKRTKVMNFEAALEFRTGEIEQPKVRVEGFDAEEFSACVWGGATLKRVEKHKPIYAYGIAKFKNTEYALYIEKNEKKSMIINLDEENERKSKFKANKKDKHLRSLVYLLKRKQGRPVAYSRWQDFSPIKKGLQDIEARIVEASGSKAAILNYGNFLQSNMHGGFRRYRKIMWETYHSVIPKLVRTFMPDMFSAPNLIEVNVSGEIVFEGERCVNTVKYIRTGNSGRTIIDCKGSKAFVRFEDEEDDEDSYDEYTEMMLDD